MPWEGEIDESLARQDTWLLSFIDILALLLTLFVLLLAYQDQGQKEADIENTRTTSLTMPFNLSLLAFPSGGTVTNDFGHSGTGLLPLDTDAGYPMANDTEIVSIESVTDALPEPVHTVENMLNESASSGSESISQTIPPIPALLAEIDPHTELLPEELHGPPLPSPVEIIQQKFDQRNFPQSVDIISRPGAVSIEISDNILFETASATLSSAGQQLLNEVAMVLAELHYPLSVEGHTDNVPIRSSRFPSNWDLSSARAAMATRALIKQGIAAYRLRAIGYGDTQPRADNNTAEGRAKNRRVSLVLQVNEPERTPLVDVKESVFVLHAPSERWAYR